MTDLPSISIVVPNYNGGATIGRTLQSLIDQDYPNLEIIVIDGGSTDNSVDVIQKYQEYITWWVSETDTGQSNAINKGFAKATGTIVNWLCSDDELLPGALKIVARQFSDHPEIDIVCGACHLLYTNEPWRNRILRADADLFALIPCCNPIPQGSCFYRRKLLDRQPILNEQLHYAMDFELWNHFRSKGATWLFITDVLGIQHFSGDNKTATGNPAITLEFERVYRSYVKERIPLTFWHRKLRYPLERIRRKNPGLLFGLFIYYPYQCTIILALSPFYGFSRVRWMNWVEFS